MSGIKFEGDVEQVSDKQLQFISGILKEKGFGEAHVRISSVGKPGDNYAANVKRIVVQQGAEIIKMIAKIAPTLDFYRTSTGIIMAFKNEHAIYSEVLPKFNELEIKQGIPDNDRLRYPILYGALMEEPHEVILLEDLQVAGFEMLDRFKSLTDHDIKLVLKEFAKLHALSYVLKNKQPKEFEGLKSKLYNMWESFELPEMAMFFTQAQTGVLGVLEKDEHKNAVKGIISGGLEIMKKLHEMDKDSRFSVIQQGDAWTNNIMFTFEDSKTSKCCMIDYQQARINSPVADLYYMLFNCSDYETRRQHFDEWLGFYHSALDERLSEFGLKASLTYPRDQLDADLKRHGKASLCVSALMAAVLLKESAQAAKMQEIVESGGTLEEILQSTSVQAMDSTSLMKFKIRVEGLIDSHLELGLV